MAHLNNKGKSVTITFVAVSILLLGIGLILGVIAGQSHWQNLRIGAGPILLWRITHTAHQNGISFGIGVPTIAGVLAIANLIAGNLIQRQQKE